MTTWTSSELNKIGNAEELTIQSLRADGTLRKPVTIWVVCVGDDLFVRSVNGRAGAWFHGAQTQHTAHIRAGGVSKDVTLVEVPGAAINDQIDAVYRAKYHRYGERIVGSIVSPAARAATIQLAPRAGA